MIFKELNNLFVSWDNLNLKHNLIRLRIKEDEDFGSAIIEDEFGEASKWTWDKEIKRWIKERI